MKMEIFLFVTLPILSFALPKSASIREYLLINVMCLIVLLMQQRRFAREWEVMRLRFALRIANVGKAREEHYHG